MAEHIWQKRFNVCSLFAGSFMSEITICSINAKTSVEFSIESALPLSLLIYRLTADCESPSSFAACCSLNPWFSTIDFAILAFTAGKTVFTPTSHGSIKLVTD